MTAHPVCHGHRPVHPRSDSPDLLDGLSGARLAWTWPTRRTWPSTPPQPFPGLPRIGLGLPRVGLPRVGLGLPRIGQPRVGHHRLGCRRPVGAASARRSIPAPWPAPCPANWHVPCPAPARRSLPANRPANRHAPRHAPRGERAGAEDPRGPELRSQPKHLLLRHLGGGGGGTALSR